MVYSPVNAWTFPVNPNFPWAPDSRVISNITQANPCVVTTTVPHGYSTGFKVRIVLPFPYMLNFGMYQINEMTSLITVLSPTTFSMTIDTRGFDPFVLGTTLQQPQVIPIGQETNADLDDFTQVNPPNPQGLDRVVVFQNPGLQAPGACNTSQT